MIDGEPEPGECPIHNAKAALDALRALAKN